MKKILNKTILLAGSTGYIGKYVLKLLLYRGYKVICIGRSLNNDKKIYDSEHLIFHKINLCAMSEFQKLEVNFTKLDAVISCLGTKTGAKKDSWDVEYLANKNILDFATSKGLNRFILLSAICVQKPKLEFQYAKLAFEKKLITSGINYSIVRPTAYFKSLAGQVDRIKSGKSFIFFDNGKKTSCKPISEQNLAEFICDCLVLNERNNKILPIGGAGPDFTPKDQAELIFKILARPTKVRSIPSYIFKIFSFFIYPFTVFSEKLKDLREFSQIGYYYATESMLVWDKKEKKYSPDDTPEYGDESLEDFYRKVIEYGMDGHELGDHKLF